MVTYASSTIKTPNFFADQRIKGFREKGERHRYQKLSSATLKYRSCVDSLPVRKRFLICKLSIYARLICYSVHVVKASQLYESVCTHVNITRRQILLTLPSCGNYCFPAYMSQEVQYSQFVVVKIIF